jgi:pyruvate dehydrogenase E1 component alpha subunit
MGTQVERSSAEVELSRRGSGYNMPHVSFDGNDVDSVIESVGQAAHRARNGEGPSYLVANTYRFRGHSMSDAMKYRSREEQERARQRDPIVLYERRLRDKGLIDDNWMTDVQDELRKIIDDSVHFADQSPHPDSSELYVDVLSEQYPMKK